jgi:quinoprotein glucose dehydrogenase
MPTRRSLTVALLLLPITGCLLGAGPLQETRPAEGAASLPKISLRRAFPRLSFLRPVYLTHAGDGTDRLFVLERRGRIRVFADRRDVETAGVFLDLQSQVSRRHNEEGLLALAFHPDYRTNGRFYVYYSASSPRRGILSEFRVDPEDPDRADPGFERVILEVEQPWGNHNGATVLFGPDGYLYISLGDGGAANDPLGAGQDLSTLLGSILRIDVDRRGEDRAYGIPPDNPFVDRSDTRPEIWAYGLRNVWRMSFDRRTGDLWAGDVGQNRWEEIDLIVKGGNYGWNIREGAHFFGEGGSGDGLIDPVAEYPQREGRTMVGLSVTGGNVYRGSAYPALEGVYLYGDYVTGRIWALRHDQGRVTGPREVYTPPPRHYIASFGEDEAGELYICAFENLNGHGGASGRIYRIGTE